MAFVDKLAVEVEIPHERGNYITYRPLKGGELREAEAVRRREALAAVKEIDPETMAQAMRAREDRAALAGPAAHHPGASAEGGAVGAVDYANDYDLATVVSRGLVKLRGPFYDATWKGLEVAAEDALVAPGFLAAADLDAKTEEFAFGLIMEATLVPPA